MMVVAQCWDELHGTGSHEVDGCGFPDLRSVTDGGERRVLWHIYNLIVPTAACRIVRASADVSSPSPFMSPHIRPLP